MSHTDDMALYTKEYIMENQDTITPPPTPSVYHGLFVSVVEHLGGRFLSSSSVVFDYCGWKVVNGVATPSKSAHVMSMIFNHSMNDEGMSEWWGITEDSEVVMLQLPRPRTGKRYYAFVKSPPRSVKFEDNHRIRWLVGEATQNLLAPKRGDHVSGRVTPLMEQFFASRGVIVDRS
jgi:hypothetical protein